MEKRGEIYLDAELDFRDEKNFAAVITKAGAASLRAKGVDDPAEHFRDKTIRVTGTVKTVDGVPRIEIDDAQQIRLVEAAEPSEATTKALKRIEQLGGKAGLDRTGNSIDRIHLGGTKADDDDLVLLGALPELLELSLAKTRISDAGLRSLAGLKKLEALHLADNPITDKGVAALKDMTRLQLLGLKGTQVTDAGLVHLAHMTNLQWLGLRNTKVTDAGLVHLMKLPQLPGVSLSYCKVTDAGLAHLKVLTRMQRLVLDHTGISDAGLAYLKDMADLHTLDLSQTTIGDAGLAHLQGLAKLHMLELTGTQITRRRRLAHLAKLARLQSPDHDKNKAIVEGAIPPKGLPPLPGLALGETKISDAGLAHLKALPGIQRLELSKTRITDAGLAYLQSLTALRVLDLKDTVDHRCRASRPIQGLVEASVARSTRNPSHFGRRGVPGPGAAGRPDPG